MSERMDGKISRGAADYLMSVFGINLEQAAQNPQVIQCLEENVADGFLDYDLEILSAIACTRETKR